MAQKGLKARVVFALALGSLLWLSDPVVALPNPATANSGEPVRLLFIVPREGWHPKAEIDAVYREHLKKRGFEITLILSDRMLTLDYLKQFNCVIIAGVASDRLIGYRAPALLTQIAGNHNEAAYREYVAAGGGLLFHLRTSDIGAQCAAGMSNLLKPYGMSTEAECVRDPSNDRSNMKDGSQGGYSYAYSWTDNVTKSPITEGVRRLYYPTATTRWDDAYSTNPLILKDKAWMPIVKGGPGSGSFVKTGTYVHSWWKPGTIRKPPVIVAVRQFGKGRMVVSGINAFYTVVHCSSAKTSNGMECNTGTIDMITMRNGSVHLWEGDVHDMDALILKIAQQAAAGAPSPARAIWALVAPAQAKELASRKAKAKTPDNILSGRFGQTFRKAFVDVLKNATKSNDFYRPEDWKGVKLDGIAAQLIKKGSARTELDTVEVNRRLLKAAYPAHFPADVARSDGLVLFDNLYLWLAEPGLKTGFGKGSVEPTTTVMDSVFSSSDVIPGLDMEKRTIDWDKVKTPRTWATGVTSTRWGFYPEIDDPLIGPEMRYYKVLVGAHTRYSTGKNTVKEMAAAAKEAGYSAIAFTEWFPELTYDEWVQLRADCEAASTDGFHCLAGIDIEDVNRIRYAIFGQERYPFDWWLDKYRRLLRNQATFLQFASHVAAVHRTGSSRFDYRLLKHFCGVAIENWANESINYNRYLVQTDKWKRVDNGWPCYLWQAANESNPMPIVIKEARSVDDIPKAAENGMDLIMPADTLANAVTYLHQGMGAWWDDPGRFFVSSGPIITRWAIRNKDEGTNSSLKRWRVGIGVKSDEAIREIRMLDGFNLYRRWTPNAAEFEIDVDGRHGMQHHFVLVVTDAKGRRAISPTIRTVSMPGYFMRCGDRQNFFNTPMSYTGTRMPLFGISMPVAGFDEGRGYYVGVHGACGCPVGEYRMASNALSVTEATLDMKWAWATDHEICFDARPLYSTTRSNVIDGKVRFMHLQGTPWIMCEAVLRPRHPFAPASRIWPVIVGGGRTGVMTDPKTGADKEFEVKGVMPVPKGTYIGNRIVLSDGMVTDGRVLGFDRGESGQPVSTDDQWRGSFLVKKGGNTVFFVQNKISKEEAIKLRSAMGFSGKTPYTITTTQGRFEKVEVVAHFQAENGGVAGKITAADIGYSLPLRVAGINPNIDFVVWQPGKTTLHYGVFEGAGWARLNIKDGAEFYAGNIVTCDQPALKISVPEWTDERILIQVNNSTDKDLTATIRTPAAVRDRMQLEKEVTVKAGASVDVRE